MDLRKFKGNELKQLAMFMSLQSRFMVAQVS